MLACLVAVLLSTQDIVPLPTPGGEVGACVLSSKGTLVAISLGNNHEEEESVYVSPTKAIRWTFVRKASRLIPVGILKNRLLVLSDGTSFTIGQNGSAKQAKSKFSAGENQIMDGLPVNKYADRIIDIDVDEARGRLLACRSEEVGPPSQGPVQILARGKWETVIADPATSAKFSLDGRSIFFIDAKDMKIKRGTDRGTHRETVADGGFLIGEDQFKKLWLTGYDRNLYRIQPNNQNQITNNK